MGERQWLEVEENRRCETSFVDGGLACCESTSAVLEQPRIVLACECSTCGRCEDISRWEYKLQLFLGETWTERKECVLLVFMLCDGGFHFGAQKSFKSPPRVKHRGGERRNLSGSEHFGARSCLVRLILIERIKIVESIEGVVSCSIKTCPSTRKFLDNQFHPTVYLDSLLDKSLSHAFE